MGTGDWLKTIISRKKKNKERPKQDSADQPLKLKSLSHNDPNKLLNGALNGNSQDCGMTIEVIAAIRIQTAFRGFKARKTLGSLRRTQKLQAFTYHNSVKKQTTNTLIHVHAWSKIQAEIRARRANMVAEGRIRQKKHDNQLKLEAKLHDLEVDWNGGSETKEEIIARIQQREEASVKRERAMAYAFSHQWRANSGMNQGPFVFELAKGNWEWSWVDKWIAAQPWETRPSTLTKVVNRVGKGAKLPSSVKHASIDGKEFAKKPSKQSDEETTNQESNTKAANSGHSRTKTT